MLVVAFKMQNTWLVNLLFCKTVSQEISLDQAGIKFRDLLTSPFRVLGLKVCTTPAGSEVLIVNVVTKRIDKLIDRCLEQWLMWNSS